MYETKRQLILYILVTFRELAAVGQSLRAIGLMRCSTSNAADMMHAAVGDRNGRRAQFVVITANLVCKEHTGSRVSGQRIISRCC